MREQRMQARSAGLLSACAKSSSRRFAAHAASLRRFGRSCGASLQHRRRGNHDGRRFPSGRQPSAAVSSPSMATPSLRLSDRARATSTAIDCAAHPGRLRARGHRRPRAARRRPAPARPATRTRRDRASRPAPRDRARHRRRRRTRLPRRRATRGAAGAAAEEKARAKLATSGNRSVWILRQRAADHGFHLGPRGDTARRKRQRRPVDDAPQQLVVHGGRLDRRQAGQEQIRENGNAILLRCRRRRRRQGTRQQRGRPSADRGTAGCRTGADRPRSRVAADREVPKSRMTTRPSSRIRQFPGWMSPCSTPAACSRP